MMLLLFRTTLLLLFVVVVVAASITDGIDSITVNPFYCTLEHSHDAQHCVDAKEGHGCYWCHGGSLHGICVSPGQATALIQKIPGVACESKKVKVTPVPVVTPAAAPYDMACLSAGMDAADGAEQEDCDATIDDEDGAPCVWCDGAGVFGLCLSANQASQASPYLQCDDNNNNNNNAAVAVAVHNNEETQEDSTLVMNPYDVTCAVAGYTSGDDGEDICKSTDDEDGSPCVWCYHPNGGEGQAGLCLTDAQAQIAEQISLECDTTTTASISAKEKQQQDSSTVATTADFDMTCVKAGIYPNNQQDCTTTETTATTTNDDETYCVWCPSSSNRGLCVTPNQATIMAQVGIDCNDDDGTDGTTATIDVQDNPYDVTCAIAAGGETVCQTTDDQDGAACVWCSYGGQGLCLTDAQAEIAGQLQFECDSNSAALDGEGNPYDVTCAIAGYSAGGDGKGVCKTTQDQDGDGCVWCSYGGQGLCLTDEQAEIAGQMQFECDDAAAAAATIVEDNPYDVTCAIAGYTAGGDGEDVCKTTDDQDGDACVWCSYGGQGLCLTDEQAEVAGQMQFQCDDAAAAAATIVEDNPYDVTCAIAGYTAGGDGETVCQTTDDQDGDACVWCSYGGQGLCLTDEQAEIAGQMQFQCDDAAAAAATIVEDNPYDVTCAIAGYTAGGDGEDVCKTTDDQDGDACVWCSYGGQGLCLTDEQAEIAGQMQFECEDAAAAAATIVEDNPYDVTCAIAGYTAGGDGEDVCKTTDDQDGDACVWCSYGGQGLCLTDEQAEIAGQMQFECDGDHHITALDVEDNPYDVTCAIAGYSAGADGKGVCKTTQDQDGDTCVWCSYGGQGLCLTDQQASIADQINFDCEEDKAVEDNAYDVTCAVAGYSAGGDGENVCKTTQDQDGDMCVWCSYGGQGLCLTDEQASIADQLNLACEESSNVEEEVDSNPYDMSCGIAGRTAGDDGASVCRATEDQEGDMCVWCSYGGQGLCLTDDQANIVEQMHFECDAHMADPIPPTVEDCLKNVQEEGCDGAADENGSPCTWCKTVVGFGLCFSEEAKQMAEAEFGVLFQCNDAVTSLKTAIE
eukprot:CAMPEP_0119029916 /NCGR_PEP_ID=MMETSP1176-20130426/40763_1 /TAXON_ID=265551 /ORGANISM="Synedropsis recta cf, Strain CCMP1620" /LENGTH=1076 /DNA_ID=CAMNT_0006986277 /DNA_START=31 /DNA_END=3261 /DNA_ORIENTATION=+